MEPTIEKISAVTLRVTNMTESVRFYRDVLGMTLLYGGEDAGFSSQRAKDAQSAILNLEQGDTVTLWGRLIFYVTDVDALWNHMKDRGFDPEIPRDASWGERYFHMPDPDGHELSFARPATMTWRKLLVRRRAFHTVVIPVAGVHAAPLKYGSTVMPHSSSSHSGT
jgi:catechol 2,3-dioxygenase-like lactoylglutathione lyase family enzyme